MNQHDYPRGWSGWSDRNFLQRKVKNMKKFVKLIPAIVMLLIAASLVGTSTYAWFSMNNTVKATGMSVTAKSDQIFLMIQKGEAASADAIQSAGLIQDTAAVASAALYPAAHHLTSSATVSTVLADSGSVLKDWYYRTSSDPGHYIGSSGSGELTIGKDEADYGKYILVNTFSITVADGSNAVSNLRVEKVTINSTDNAAVNVLVAGSDASEEFVATANGEQVINGTGIALRTSNLDSDHVEVVKVYIYWNGNDTDVYTNNIEHLLNTSVEVVFTGTVVPA